MVPKETVEILNLSAAEHHRQDAANTTAGKRFCMDIGWSKLTLFY